MAAVLTLAATGTGALVGFVAGVALVPLTSRGVATGAWVGAGLVVAAVAADAVTRRRGRPRPPAVNRQVPQAWSRLFAPTTTALLYGARLGVGPLTILPTWLWWAALVAGALAGPWTGAAAGGLFGAARSVVSVTAGEWAAGAAAPRMRRLQAAEPAAHAAVSALAVAGAAVVLLAGASG